MLMVAQPKLSYWVKRTNLPMGRAMVRWHTARRWVSCCSMNSWSLQTHLASMTTGGISDSSGGCVGVPDFWFLGESDPHWFGGLQ